MTIHLSTLVVEETDRLCKKKKKKKKANHGGNLDSANILAVLVEEISSAIFQIVHRNL